MRKLLSISALALALAGVSGAAHASGWEKVMKVDPYEAKDGSAHYYDFDTTFQDRKTGWIVTRLQFTSPARAAAGDVPTWYLWAFDCKASTMRSIGVQGNDGFTPNADWRSKPESLSQPHMNGVTNELEEQLCDFDGLWDEGDIAY